MSGFWAGAVPPWAYAVGACLFILAVLIGMWAGYERGFKHAAEEQQWEREQAKARRVHAVYREGPAWPLFERAHEARLAAEDQAMILANGQAVTTGEIQAITDEMDTWLAQHVYAAPADYGQWLERRDGHAAG